MRVADILTFIQSLLMIGWEYGGAITKKIMVLVNLLLLMAFNIFTKQMCQIGMFILRV